MPICRALTCAVLFVSFLTPVSAQTPSRPTDYAQEKEQPAKAAGIATPQDKGNAPRFHPDSEAEKEENQDKVFKLIPAEKTVWDWISFSANLVLAMGGIAGIVIAVCTLKSIQKQTTAMETQVDHLLSSARPWLLIKATGDGKARITFTAHNTGNSPAQIIWSDPFIPGIEVPVNETLPPIPTYWAYTEGNELVNSVWVEPGGKEEIGVFDQFEAFPPNARLMVYSMVRYRNTFDDNIHESRFCYRVSQGVFAMDGPPGYNYNT